MPSIMFDICQTFIIFAYSRSTSMKKFIISTSAAILLLSASIPSFADTRSLPEVEILGTKYYVYVSKKGDTLYGIARERKWDDKELARLNPSVISPMKKGVRIYYPVNPIGNESPAPDKQILTPITELTHVVGKGESVYSIASLYDIPVDKIYSLNPASKNGIKNGDILLLREPSRSITPGSTLNDSPGFYTMGRTDNLKDIAEVYETSVGAILAMNPAVSPGNIKPGTVLKIPMRGTGLVEVTKNIETPVVQTFDTYTVQSNDTWQSISDKTGVDTEVLNDANPGIRVLKKKQVISVPKITNVSEEMTVTERDVREQTQEGQYKIYKDIHKVAEPQSESVTVKVAILSDSPSSKKDSEFIRGFLTGIDNLKKENFKINLKVVDGSHNVDEAVEQLNSFQPNLVFFTGDRNIPDYVNDYALSSLTTVVNTFDVRSEDYLNNPYLIQLLTPSAYFNESVASNVYDKFGDYELLIVGDEDSSDQLAPELKKFWNPKRIKYMPEGIPNAEMLDANDKYLIYAYTVKKNEIEQLLKEVMSVKEVSPFAEFAVLGRPNWIIYDEALAEDFYKANTFIPSRFYLDSSCDRAKFFYNSYKNLFNRTPAKSVPLYAAVGYDTSTYFISALGHTSNDLNLIKPSRNTLQSEFDLKRISNWSGFINPPVYLVNFTPYENIEKIIIK